VAYELEQLRTLSDEDLVKQYDRLAQNTTVGVNFYLAELDRRERNRLAESTDRLARNAYRLTWANALLAAVAAVAAIVALFT
jgi:hypothetical protein